MPRDGSNIYHVPAGTTAVTDTTIESAKYNAYTADVEQDLNLPRPIVAGGTGASTAAAALIALGGEQAKQIITNYASDIVVPGSFYSATTATSAPVAGHAFAGICYAADATNMVMQARDLTDANHYDYVRIMSGGVWGSFSTGGGTFVLKGGDTMTGLLTLSADPSNPLQAATKQYTDTKAGLAVLKAGDTMTGLLTLSGNPSTALQAAPKQYADLKVALGGDTMTGLLTLSANPSTALQAATKQYVDSGDAAAVTAAFMQNYLTGLVLSTAGASATFGIAKGQAADSTNANLMTLASAYTKTTAAWAVGSGNGALDTGAIAINTWYHVHLIKRLDTGVVDVLFSLSPTAPTLPTNYTVFRRIGSILSNASSQWTKFVQIGDTFLWDAPPQDVAGTGLSGSNILFVLTVPTGLSVTATLRYYCSTTSGTMGMGMVSPLTSTTAGATGLYLAIVVSATGGAGTGDTQIVTDTSARIRMFANASGGTQTTYINTHGWIDTRGK